MKLNDSLRQSIINAGGTPRARSLRGLLQQLVPLYGGSTFPDNDNVNGLLRAAIIGSGGTPTARKFRGLLAQLVQARGGTVTGNEKPSELGVKLAATNGGFAPVTGAALSTPVESNTITLSNLVGTPAITVTGGQYSKNGAAYTGSAGTVTSGDTVKVRLTSSASYSTMVQATLTIGGVPRVFSVTTMDNPTPTPTPTPTPVIPTPVATQRITISDAPRTPVSAATTEQIINAKTRKGIPTSQLTSANQPATYNLTIDAIAAPGGWLWFCVSGTGNGTLADPVIEQSFDSTDYIDGTWTAVTWTPIKPSTGVWENRPQLVQLAAGAGRKLRLTLRDAGTRTIIVNGPIVYQRPSSGNPNIFVQCGDSHSDGTAMTMMREMMSALPDLDPILLNYSVAGQNRQQILVQTQEARAQFPEANMYFFSPTGNNTVFPYPSATTEQKNTYATEYGAIITSLQNDGKIALPERMTYRQNPYEGITTVGTANQEQGGLGWNVNVIDPLVASLRPQVIDPNTGYGICDNYVAMLWSRQGLSTDGNHGDMRWSHLARIHSYVRLAATGQYITMLEFLVRLAETEKTPWFVDRVTEVLTAIPDGSYKMGLAARLAALAGPRRINIATGTAVDATTVGARTQNWNNVTNTLTGANLIDTQGNVTGVSLATTGGNWTSTTGDINPAGVPEIYDFPVQVLRSRSTAANARTLTLSGLDNSKKYAINIAGFRGANLFPDLSLYTIGGVQRALRGGEWDGMIRFTGISPVGGVIAIDVAASGGTSGVRCISGLSLTEEPA